MNLHDFNKKKKQLPDTPGVYFFLGPKREVLYIGKATSLRDRVRSYFSPDLAAARSPLVVQMVEKARSIDWRETDSVLEALILESSLIKTHKPHHNTLEKDDKSFNYVIITDETFPRVLVVRGKELDAPGLFLKTKNQKLKTIFGPFPHGAQLKEAMKIIRKIFPFRDKCNPPHPNPLPGRGEGAARARPCFNRQIGLCPGVCSGEVSAAEYGRTIRHIMLFLGGHKKKLLTTLESEMKKAARSERFEEAARLRGQMFALQHIQDVSLIKDEVRWSFGLHPSSQPSPREGGRGNPHRIEAYDTAHWQGSAAVGVMVAVENGEAVPAEYRTFGIKSAASGDDVGALREVLSRRLAHDEWRLPRLVVADGGKAQLAVAEKVLADAGFRIPVVAVVKDEHHRARGILGDAELVKKYEKEILLANSEAHRFSLAHHRKTRRLKDK